MLFNRKAVPVRAGPIWALGRSQCFPHRTSVGTNHWIHEASYPTHTECFIPGDKTVYFQYTAEIKNTWRYASTNVYLYLWRDTYA
jgi:hypothetical protein